MEDQACLGRASLTMMTSLEGLAFHLLKDKDRIKLRKGQTVRVVSGAQDNQKWIACAR